MGKAGTYCVRGRPLDHEATHALLVQHAALAAQHGAQSREAIKVRNRLVEGHLGLVWAVWHASYRERVEKEDVVGIGSQGLMMAIERFDVSRGFRFSTYALHWIRHVLGRTHANEGHTIRVPVHAQENNSRAGRQCIEAGLAARRVCSLDVPIGEDHPSTFQEMLPDFSDVEALDHEATAAALEHALATLPAELRLAAEHLANGGTVKHLAEAEGMSRERATHLREQALGHLRRQLAA